VRKILAISPDKACLKSLKWGLEGAGYVVALSDSLEQSFLEGYHSDHSLVIVDSEALSEQAWEVAKLLNWFHHRSPVLILTSGPITADPLHCDCRLPKSARTDELLACIRRLER
jgi:DNA-binding response OmpR family regulator